jgi:LuxR family maltose regulon positive regulatory protein
MASTELARSAPIVDESKLRRPSVRPGVVPRARLEPLRQSAARSRLVLVSAPAGYGKSTLVTSWSELDPRVTAWLQLDHGDNDPVVLLCYLAAEGSLAILEFLVDHVPAGSQLVLATRGEPGVPLGRLRATGDLVEVETADIALDADETRAVAASGGLELTVEAAQALRERTEGWAAAVVLAALSLGDRPDAAERAAGLSGEQRHIADYLLEEVLKNQPEGSRRFCSGRRSSSESDAEK